MSSSLQEQLVQAGLANEESPARSRQGGRGHAGGKRGGGRKQGAGRQARRSGQQATGDSKDRDAPPRKTTAKTAEKAAPAPARQPTAEEKADRLRQMIRANRIDRSYASVPYRFTQGSRIREIAVTGTQQGRIARGELAVVSDGERNELVPEKVARQVRGIDPAAVLVLNTGESRGDDADDDPYADYRVPNDLMW